MKTDDLVDERTAHHGMIRGQWFHRMIALFFQNTKRITDPGNSFITAPASLLQLRQKLHKSVEDAYLVNAL